LLEEEIDIVITFVFKKILQFTFALLAKMPYPEKPYRAYSL